MLLETREQIITNKVKKDVSFILLHDQQKVYDEFIRYLNHMEITDPKVSYMIPTKQNEDPLKIPYDRKSRTKS